MRTNIKVKKKRPWESLEHNGPVFTPPYQPLPEHVKFKYNGKVVKLSQNAEEVAGFYARKLHLPCVTKATFNNNFFAGWREVMTSTEKGLIQDLSKCDFKGIQEYYIKTKNKQIEIEKELAKKNDEIYGYCIVDGEKQRIKNYKIEPPDLFCSIGESPLMGALKKRITPEDVTINCSDNENIPKPPPGHYWREVKHINTFFWLASWVSNIKDEIKYISLHEKSNQKQITERNKYEIARQLHEHIDEIRERYRADWEADVYGNRQRGVALYLIDSFGFRAGNETEDGAADTVGCCSLKVKHIRLCGNNEVEFNFYGKASIIYNNNVFVKEPVYNNLISFIANKNGDDDLFDQLETSQLNDYLKAQMPNLTAKVFRTYLACTTFEKRLNELTYSKTSQDRKRMLNVFKQANSEVAILLNHKKTKKSRKNVTLMDPNSSNADDKIYATGTSLSNYIDPRIAVTWCERFDVPIKEVYTETLRKKFSWAIDEAGPNFLFSW